MEPNRSISFRDCCQSLSLQTHLLFIRNWTMLASRCYRGAQFHAGLPCLLISPIQTIMSISSKYKRVIMLHVFVNSGGGEMQIKDVFCCTNRLVQIQRSHFTVQTLWKLTLDQSCDPHAQKDKKRSKICSLLSGCCTQSGNMKFLDLFGRLKSVVIGMIHVRALPGKLNQLISLKLFFPVLK